MKRPLPIRLMALLMAAILLLAGGREAAGIGACPHHDAAPRRAAGDAADARHRAEEPGVGRAAYEIVRVGSSDHAAQVDPDGGPGDPVHGRPAHPAGPNRGHGHLADAGLDGGTDAPPGHDGGCTCLGSCQGGAATPIPYAGGVVVGVPAAPRAGAIPSDGGRDLPGPPPHDHPFATAPPPTR